MLAILDGAIDWLGSQGTDQWAGARWRAEELRPDLETGGLRVAETLAGPLTAADGSAAAVPAVAGSPLPGRGGGVASLAVVGSWLPAMSGSPPLVPRAGAASLSAAGSPPRDNAAGAESTPAGAGCREAARRPVPVGTMTLGAEAPSPWLPSDDPASALYLSHFAVDRRFAGLGVGAWLIDQAADEARRCGKQSLRLAAWTGNTRLHAYYRRQGFRLVRIAGGRSGALFERAVSPP